MKLQKAQCAARIVSALEKVFPDQAPGATPPERTVLLRDIHSFQIAYQLDARENRWCTLRVDSPLLLWLKVRAVRLSPSAYPCHPQTDDNYLRTAPGLYPDRLEVLPGGRLKLVAGQWRSLWIDLETTEETPAGIHPITITAFGDACEYFSATTEVEVLPITLPEGDLLHSEWFHADCLADYYRVPAFSEQHFGLIDRFLQAAARRGVNVILTPLFTPPLDTGIGGERTTVQLVGVYKMGDQYAFDFSLLRRWVKLLCRHGVKWFEMAHLFSQWGARYAPKIMATVDGVRTQLFGWHTEGTGALYEAFLAAFLPALNAELHALGIEGRCIFHISDEPGADDLETYRRARALVERYLPGYPIMDALSAFSLHQEGAVTNPIVAVDHIEPFLKAGVKGLWAYMCTSQSIAVSNRFFSMPSARNRILGVQLYKFRIKGFLHWGYNFYNAQLSTHPIDPYAVTDAGEAFPSGDPFLVYPGPNGTPEESIRIMVLQHALHDIRALKLLESLTGYEQALRLIEGQLEEPITFSQYPREDAYLIGLRDAVNEAIRKALQGGNNA